MQKKKAVKIKVGYNILLILIVPIETYPELNSPIDSIELNLTLQGDEVLFFPAPFCRVHDYDLDVGYEPKVYSFPQSSEE